MSNLNVIEFPGGDCSDIVKGLRKLADEIEAGDYDAAHNLVWVIDCGEGRLELGMLGQSPEAGAVAHLLLAMAQRKLELA